MKEMEYSEDELLGLINGEQEKQNDNVETIETEKVANKKNLDERLNDIDRVLDVSLFLLFSWSISYQSKGPIS